MFVVGSGQIGGCYYQFPVWCCDMWRCHQQRVAWEIECCCLCHLACLCHRLGLLRSTNEVRLFLKKLNVVNVVAVLFDLGLYGDAVVGNPVELFDLRHLTVRWSSRWTVYVVCCRRICVFSGFVFDVVGVGYVAMKNLQLVIKSTGVVRTCNHEQRIFEGASWAGMVQGDIHITSLNDSG